VTTSGTRTDSNPRYLEHAFLDCSNRSQQYPNQVTILTDVADRVQSRLPNAARLLFFVLNYGVARMCINPRLYFLVGRSAYLNFHDLPIHPLDLLRYVPICSPPRNNTSHELLAYRLSPPLRFSHLSVSLFNAFL